MELCRLHQVAYGLLLKFFGKTCCVRHWSVTLGVSTRLVAGDCSEVKQRVRWSCSRWAALNFNAVSHWVDDANWQIIWDGWINTIWGWRHLSTHSLYVRWTQENIRTLMSFENLIFIDLTRLNRIKLHFASPDHWEVKLPTSSSTTAVSGVRHISMFSMS